ncbi:DUF1015 domain-containing protein [Methylomagnum ishizawai]|uniref:DUF1015 domain-containing protein n=1 Tax=Methylomagnum ishizawai TaxID=1760988 RepID=UPI001C343270|nr:DUF1015 family protein [Methylomagnum ishizawai]BBL75229.1 hypothetical protein MishRS11D_23270 [Methylomagnum ishizawai]
MPLVRPFAALRPAPGRATEIIAPPYDVLNTAEARALAQNKPWSFLHISKPEIDLPEGTDPYAPEVYAKAAQNLADMIAAGVLQRDGQPCYYVYRLVMDGRSQVGLVASASVAAYDSHRIRRHEFTRPDKEDDRVRQIDALNAQTGPVLLAYPDAPAVDAILAEVSAGTPEADAVAESGVRHTLWVVRDARTIAELTGHFEALPALYIADGHHRSAAASRIAAARRTSDAEADHEYFLAVMFPYHQMRILDYNRLIRDLQGLDEAEFLNRVADRFDIEASADPVHPAKPGEFGLYLGGRWRRLNIHSHLIPQDPVGRLDVSLLHAYLIEPILGIADARRDKRIDFVGGIRGLGELERRVDSGEMVLAFSLYPTRMQDLMAVADVGEVMPPKSTWFEPKLADGMVSHVIV